MKEKSKKVVSAGIIVPNLKTFNYQANWEEIGCRGCGRSGIWQTWFHHKSDKLKFVCKKCGHGVVLSNIRGVKSRLVDEVDKRTGRKCKQKTKRVA